MFFCFFLWSLAWKEKKYSPNEKWDNEYPTQQSRNLFDKMKEGNLRGVLANGIVPILKQKGSSNHRADLSFCHPTFKVRWLLLVNRL